MEIFLIIPVLAISIMLMVFPLWRIFIGWCLLLSGLFLLCVDGGKEEAYVGVIMLLVGIILNIKKNNKEKK